MLAMHHGDASRELVQQLTKIDQQGNTEQLQQATGAYVCVFSAFPLPEADEDAVGVHSDVQDTSYLRLADVGVQ